MTSHSASPSARATTRALHPLNVAIDASAGSGKTHQLSQRFADLVCHGAAPESILAATFTRKASAEIARRAIRALIDRATPVDAPRATIAREGLSRIARAGARMHISTLDGFFARIAQGMALDSNALPAWRIADEDEDERGRIAAVVEAVTRSSIDDALEVVRILSRGAMPSSPIDAVLRAVRDVEHEFDAHNAIAGGVSAWLLTDLPSTSDVTPEVASSWADAIARAPVATTKAGEANKQQSKARDALAAMVRARLWRDVCESTLGTAIVRAADAHSHSPHAHGADQPSATFARAIIPAALIEAAATPVRHATTMVLSTFRTRSERVGSLIHTIAQIHRRARFACGHLRFSDVPEVLLRGRARHEERREDVGLDLALALDSRVDHMLLDEFQDTSIVQFRVLLPLIEEIVASPDRGRTFLCVGDPKQSLYRWRGAEPELLGAVLTRFPSVARESLTVNWRSSPHVLRAADLALVPTAASGRREVPEAFAAPLADALGDFAGHTPRHANRAGAAALVEIQPEAPPTTRHDSLDDSLDESDDDRARRPNKADINDAIDAYVASRVVAIRSAAPWASIGVIVRRNARVANLLTSLRDRGEPASEEAGVPLAHCPSVAFIASLIHLAAHPSDTASYHHIALVAQHLGIADKIATGDPLDLRAASRTSAVWRRRIARVGLARVVDALARTLTRRTPLGPASSGHDIARLTLACDMAHAFEFDQAPSDDDGQGLASFARALRSRPVPDSSRARTTVLTVHKSKGLEFDAVLLVDLDDAWGRDRALVIDRADDDGHRSSLAPIRRVFLTPDACTRRLSPALSEAYAFQKRRALAEDVCTLYVAMTRAVHFMELIVGPPRGGASLSAAPLLRSRLAVPGTATPRLAPQGVRATLLYHEGDYTDDAWATAATRERAPLGPAPSPAAAHPRTPPRDRPTRQASLAPWRLPRASPSGLEDDGERALGPIFAPRDATPREHGNRFHEWASLIEWLDDTTSPSPHDLVDHARSKGLTNASREEDLLREAFAFVAFLQSPTARDVLGRARYASHPGTPSVRREWPFAAFVKAQPDANATSPARLLSGRFDRVVLVNDANARPLWAEIIDFKTDDVSTDAALSQRIDRYRPQLRAYADALVSMFDLSPACVHATLLFAARPLAVSVF
jgi:ATP-dependent exoDNAse (exonuclease V) beta subunit